MKLTYHEAYNKIIDAYFKDEIRPNDMNFCFCGTLCDNTSRWWTSSIGGGGYSNGELRVMEQALFSGFPIETYHGSCGPAFRMEFGLAPTNIPDYENKLFSGMCAALEVLKEIHRARGENVDEVPEFKKRQLTISP